MVALQVIAGTCTSAGDPRLEGLNFKMVVIDEASQATEPSTLIPILKGESPSWLGLVIPAVTTAARLAQHMPRL